MSLLRFSYFFLPLMMPRSPSPAALLIILGGIVKNIGGGEGGAGGKLFASCKQIEESPHLLLQIF